VTKNFKKLDLNDLISQIDIVALIGEYGVDLEASGDNFVALCPFHPDNKTKSFFVCPTTNTWHCFGCKKGSSVFDFIMEVEHKTFWEAVQFLAEKIGYVNAFSLDILTQRLKRLDNEKDNSSLLKFRKARECVEDQIFRKIKENYKISKSLIFEREKYMKELKELWKWYDESQHWFDLQICYYKDGETIDIDFLIKKLQSFYSKFLEKFSNLTIHSVYNYIKEELDDKI
jgi:hypothetical protein